MIATTRFSPLLALALAACVSAGPPSAPATAPGQDAAGRVTALADEYLREFVARFPERRRVPGSPWRGTTG